MADLKDLQRQAWRIADCYDEYNKHAGRKTWDARDYVSGLVGDVGDLVKATMAVDGRRDIPNATSKVEHELNDIMWSLLVLYKIYQIDPERSFTDAMNTLEQRIIKMKDVVSPGGENE